MTQNQLSKQTIFLLAISTLLATVALVLSMTASPKENCWDKYSTEQEAITNCEEH